MTVGELRQRLADCDPEMPVDIQIGQESAQDVEIWHGQEIDHERSTGLLAVYRRRILLRGSAEA